MGLDLDLQKGGIFGAANGGEGQAATVAAALRTGDLPLLDAGGQVGIVAAAGSLLTALLAAWAARGSLGVCRCGWSGRRGGFGFATEELLLAQAELGTELFDLLLEEVFALDGALVHGFPVSGLSPGFKLDGEARADGTRAVRERRR